MEIHFQSLADLKKEILRSIAKRIPNIQPKNHIYFDTITSFRNFMTIQKIELLTMIATRKLTSIYELAKLVDRDFAAVLRDCISLEATGFIKLKETKDAKKSKIPSLRFAYQGLMIFMPKNPYQIEFKVAA